jgi:hypothetical protein
MLEQAVVGLAEGKTSCSVIYNIFRPLKAIAVFVAGVDGAAMSCHEGGWWAVRF